MLWLRGNAMGTVRRTYIPLSPPCPHHTSHASGDERGVFPHLTRTIGVATGPSTTQCTYLHNHRWAIYPPPHGQSRVDPTSMSLSLLKKQPGKFELERFTEDMDNFLRSRRLFHHSDHSDTVTQGPSYLSHRLPVKLRVLKYNLQTKVMISTRNHRHRRMPYLIQHAEWRAPTLSQYS